MKLKEKALVALEFDKIREMLASLCPTSGWERWGYWDCGGDGERLTGKTL